MEKKLSKIIGCLSFVIIFIFGVGADGVFNREILIIATVKASIGAAVIWVLFSVILDILFKTTLEDIPYNELDKLEGGIIQHISEFQDSEKVNNMSSKTDEKK